LVLKLNLIFGLLSYFYYNKRVKKLENLPKIDWKLNQKIKNI